MIKPEREIERRTTNQTNTRRNFYEK